jgi:MFS transporter, YNFM family, putative membrane transport protein
MPSRAEPGRAAILGCMLAGMCTFLNVYDTQPLLPYLQRLYNTSAIAVSLTVSSTILAVALAAPFVGLLAESVGRKKVIVPSLFALTVPTMLAATSQNLRQLIFWRFMQGLFVPGVIVVIIAYIGEEFAGGDVGKVMSSYISGTVLGGFLGRYVSGLIAHHHDWRRAFLTIGLINLAGAFCVRATLPKATHFVRAPNLRHSLSETLRHIRHPRLLAVFGVGFSALFAIVGAFTYVNFYLARPPFRLNSEQLGAIFSVYILGFFITPLAGRVLDRYGTRSTAVMACGFATVGLALTMVLKLPVIIAGLALFSTGVFIFQAIGTVQTGVVAGRSRSSAAGLYVTFYYIGGSLGATVTGWMWAADGWRASVLLLMGVCLLALILAWASSGETQLSVSPVIPFD